MDIVALDRFFRVGVLIITLIFGLLQFGLKSENAWINGGFIIFMAGIVGYYTNYLAIKMLFQPKQGKVLGWEGLVPKNKKKIAQSLGNSIQTQLLAPDIILAYIYERNLIETGTQKIATWIDQMLQDEKVRSLITGRIISLLKERGPELLRLLFDVSESGLKKIARRPEEIQKYWHIAREKMVEYISSKENREKIALNIKKLFQEEIPQLATALNRAIEQYLSQKQAIGSIGIGLKKLISFDERAIQDLLTNFIEDPETSEQFMGIMDILVEDFQTKLSSPETQALITSKVEEWVNVSSDYARQNLLPRGIEELKSYLDDEKNWKALDNFIFKTLDWVKIKIMDMMNSQEGQEQLKKYIGKVVHQINVTQLVEEQVMKLDTDELEKMILDNTGGNLIVIQVLGGVLGIIAGFIQADIRFSFPVLVLMVIAWVSYYLNTKKYPDKK